MAAEPKTKNSKRKLELSYLSQCYYNHLMTVTEQKKKKNKKKREVDGDGDKEDQVRFRCQPEEKNVEQNSVHFFFSSP